MSKLKDFELDEFRKRSVSRANKAVKNFVGENTSILKENLEKLCVALDNKENAIAGQLSYQLSTMAPLYHRSDITNMAEFLCKVLQNKNFIGVDEVYKLFKDNFAELASVTTVQPEIEQKILIRTRETLAKLSS